MDHNPAENPLNLQDETIKAYLAKHPEKTAELTSTLMSAEEEITPKQTDDPLGISGTKIGVLALFGVLILIVGFAIFKLLSV
ncbi:MAG: hypothetical protein Q8P13_01630 [bacterium]|nr:hypothetical protein [bacterium]